MSCGLPLQLGRCARVQGVGCESSSPVSELYSWTHTQCLPWSRVETGARVVGPILRRHTFDETIFRV